MKRILPFILIATMLSVSIQSCKKVTPVPDPVPTPTPAPAPVFLAPTASMNRVALLEDFTGVRCVFCPDGHVKAKAAHDLNPTKFIIIATHGGSYATPATGWADFTTPYATSLISQAKVSGYPAGTINRLPAASLSQAAQISGGMAMSRTAWAAAADKVYLMKAPVNIGAKATFDAATRKLTVKVDLYYTSEETVPNNLNVALLQDKLISKQTGGTPDPNNYEQNHVLRENLTGQWGTVITEATKVASKVTKSFTYTVPNDYHGTTVEGGGAVVINNLSVVVYVCRGQADVLNALEVDVQ